MTSLLRVPTFVGAATQANITKQPKVGFFDSVWGVTGHVVQPIFDDIYFDDELYKRQVKAFVWMQFEWDGYFKNLLPENANGTRLVMETTCGFAATYEINGLNADFIGLGNIHDEKYDDWEIVTDFISVGEDFADQSYDFCVDKLSLRMYPTDTLKESTASSDPLLYSAAVAGIFFLTSFVFFIYDLAVRRRQNKVMARVLTQDRIVSNMFPAAIRDRLYGVGDRMNGGSDSQSTSTTGSNRNLTKSKITNDPGFYGTRPIADLFLETVSLQRDIIRILT